MITAFAEWERNPFIQRGQSGTHKAIEKGLWPGGITPCCCCPSTTPVDNNLPEWAFGQIGGLFNRLVHAPLTDDQSLPQGGLK